jgi:hypothetical protein
MGDKVLSLVLANIDRNYSVIQRILEELPKMSAEMDRLRQEVAEAKTVTQSAVDLIQGLRSKIADVVANGSDPDELAALANDLDTNTVALAKAVAENTRADPAGPAANAPVEPVTFEVPVNEEVVPPAE